MRFLTVICIALLPACHLHESSTKNNPALAEQRLNKCYVDLDRLYTFNPHNLPESCQDLKADYFSIVSNKLTFDTETITLEGYYFIESTGNLSISCSECNLEGFRVFGPGTLIINGHVCQKKLGLFQCPSETFQQKQQPKEAKVDVSKLLTGNWKQSCVNFKEEYLYEYDTRHGFWDTKERINVKSISSTLNLKDRQFTYEFSVFDSEDCHGKSWKYSYTGSYIFADSKQYYDDAINFSIIFLSLQIGNAGYEIKDFAHSGKVGILRLDNSTSKTKLYLSFPDDTFQHASVWHEGVPIALFEK